MRVRRVWWGARWLIWKVKGKDVSLDTLEYIHLHKTGALLSACVITGATIAGADEALIKALRVYARGIGLAFQIIDDILDITASSDVLGKTAGKNLIGQDHLSQTAGSRGVP